MLVGSKDEHPGVDSNVVEWNIFRIEPNVANRATRCQNNIAPFELAFAKLPVFFCRNEHRGLKVKPVGSDILRV